MKLPHISLRRVCMTAATTLAAASAAMAADNEIFLADPTVYTENGKYYLSGTRFADPQGFTLLESDDLQHWTYSRPDRMILRKGGDSFGTTGFWAPQIFKDGDRYLLAYTANEQTVTASSPTLEGIYSQTTIEPVDGSEKNIDPFIFRDDDGRYYFYHVRFGGGNYIWGAEFDPAAGKIIEGTLTKCFANTQQWEHTGSYPSDPIMEGPTVIKLDGMYYIFYSANHFQSIDYAVGYATAPTPLGPWTKNENNPVINREIVGEKGSGHGDIFFDNDGNMRYVYHVHCNDQTANPRRTRIVTLKVDKSKGHPYSITADPSTIIIPTLDDSIDPEAVTSVELTGSVVGQSPAVLSYAGDGVWSGEVTLDNTTSTEYQNRNICFRLNGDDAMILRRVPGTQKVAFTSDCFQGENIRINQGTYTVTLNLNDQTFGFDAETDPYRISVFGSSVANGQGASSMQGYAYLYGKQLGSRYSKGTSAYPFKTSGVSIGGNTTTALLNRYDDLLRDFGGYVIFGLSMGNEGLHEAETKDNVFNQFRDNMLTLVEMARRDGKTPVVMNNYTRADYSAADYSYIKKMNLLIHEWDLPSVNTLGAIDDGAGHWAEGYMADSAHPNTQGHNEFMYAMVPSLFDALAEGKPLPERDMRHALTLDNGATVTFTPEERVHPFTVSVRVKAGDRAEVLSFEHGSRKNYTGRVIVNADGTVTYESPQREGFTSRKALMADGDWHDITLTHYYARGETLLYVDNVLAGSTSETLIPGAFTIGDVKAEDGKGIGVAEIFFWRSGMNGNEISAHAEGRMLKSSLELYSPLNLGEATDTGNGKKLILANKAQSLNTMTLNIPEGAGVTPATAVINALPERYFTPEGLEVASEAATRGIFIVRYSDGSARKVII